MTDAQYEAKFQEMQKYIPFLQKVIEKLKVNNVQQEDNPRKAQLQKMEMLHDLLTNKAKKLKMETLMKCEGVLIKLHAKIEKQSTFLQNDDTLLNSIKLKDKPSTSTNRGMDKKVEDISGPASPPPESIIIEDDQPVVIPTERRCSPVVMKEKSLKDSHFKPQSHHSMQNPDQRQQEHSSESKHKSEDNFQSVRERVFPMQQHGGVKHNISNEKHNHHEQNSPQQNTQHTTKVQQSSKDFHSSSSQQRPIPLVGQHLSMKKQGSSAASQRLQTVKVVITEPLPQHIKQQHFASYRQNLKPRETICHSNLRTLPQASQQSRIDPAREVNEAYSPEELWEEYNNESNCKRKNSTVFSRLGEKVPEKTSPISVPGRYTPIPDVLKSPPLTANDINNLLLESGVNKSPNSISEVGSRRPQKMYEQEEPIFDIPAPTNSLDFIRRKFAQITKLSSPQSETPASPTMDRQSMEKETKMSSPLPNERIALKFNPHPRQERLQSMSSNDGSECSTQSRVNDPRLKTKLHSTNPLQKPDFIPNTNVNVLPSINFKDPRLKLQGGGGGTGPTSGPTLLATYNQSTAMNYGNPTPLGYGARKDPRISRVPPPSTSSSSYPAAPVRRSSTTQPHYSSEENWDSEPDEPTPSKTRNEEVPIIPQVDTGVKTKIEEIPILPRIDPRLNSSFNKNKRRISKSAPPKEPSPYLTKSEKEELRKKAKEQQLKPPADLIKPRPPKSDSEEDWDAEPEDNVKMTPKPATKCDDPIPQLKTTNPTTDKEIIPPNQQNTPMTPKIHTKSDTEEDWDSEPEVKTKTPTARKEEVSISNKPSVPKELPIPQQFPFYNSPIIPQHISPGHNIISPNPFVNPIQQQRFSNTPILPPHMPHPMAPILPPNMPHPMAPTHLHANFYNSPLQHAADHNRFSAVLNDKSERFKYYEAKKQKPPTPQTYKAYREARARALEQEEALRKAAQVEQAKKRAEAEKLRKQKEENDEPKVVPQPVGPETNKKTTETTIPKKQQQQSPAQKPIIPIKTNQLKKDNIKSPAAAESTLDKMYRTQNFNSKFPKANTTFKIPKKKSEEKPQEENKKTNDLEKPQEETKKTNDLEKSTLNKPQEENKKTNDLEKPNLVKQIPKVTQNSTTVKSQNKTDHEKSLKENTNINITNKKCEINEKPETKQTTQLDKKENTKSQEKKIEEEVTEQKLEDKSSAEISRNIRDPRCRPKTLTDNTETEKESEKDKKTDNEKEKELIPNNDNSPKLSDIIITSFEKEVTLKPQTNKEPETTTISLEEKNKAALDKFNKATQEMTTKPQRILRRRNTMVLFGSAPLVDKEKLLNANALLFEDIQEQEKRKRKKEDEERQNARRMKHLEEMFQKTDDNCTVSTQNIITGKRRTRTTINFNETVVAMNVFKHISKKDSVNGGQTSSNTTTPTATAQTSKTTKNLPKAKTKTKPLHTEEEKQGEEIKTSAEIKKEKNETKSTSTKGNKEIKTENSKEDNSKNIEEISENEPTTSKNVIKPGKKKALANKKLAKETATKPVIQDDEHQNCAVSSTSAEVPSEDQPKTSTSSTYKTELDDNEPTSTAAANKLNNPTPTPEASIDVLNDIVQQIIKPNADRPHILGLLGQILSEDKLQFIKTIIENTTKQQTADAEDKTKDQLVEQTNKSSNNNEEQNDEEEPEEEEYDDLQASTSKLSKTKQAKGKTNIIKKKRNELDRLNEDIRDMFICEGVLTATGRRMCTIMGQTNNNNEVEINNKKSPNASNETAAVVAKRKVGKTNLEKSTTAKSIPLRRSLRSCRINEDEAASDHDDLEIGSESNDDLTSITDSTITDTTPPRRKMPLLKPHTPIKLSEEETPQTKEASKEKPIINNKRKQAYKPCPKSKKPKNKINENEVESESESEIEAASNSITSEQTKDKQGSLKIRNTNVHWHNQSKYINWCMICEKKIHAKTSAFHYNSHHGENYISRLAPVLLQKFKQGKLNQPLFGVDKRPKQPSWFFRCPFCLNYLNTTLPLWLEHLQNHTAEFRYECSKCHRGSNKAAIIRKHISSQCKGATMINSIVKHTAPSVVKAHVCHLCNFMQLKRVNLERHYLEQHQLDEKNVDLLGYTITLFDVENVDCVPEDKAMEKENEVRKSIQNEEQVIDIPDDDDEEERANDKEKSLEQGKAEKSTAKEKEKETEEEGEKEEEKETETEKETEKEKEEESSFSSASKNNQNKIKVAVVKVKKQKMTKQKEKEITDKVSEIQKLNPKKEVVTQEVQNVKSKETEQNESNETEQEQIKTNTQREKLLEVFNSKNVCTVVMVDIEKAKTKTTKDNIIEQQPLLPAKEAKSQIEKAEEASSKTPKQNVSGNPKSKTKKDSEEQLHTEKELPIVDLVIIENEEAQDIQDELLILAAKAAAEQEEQTNQELMKENNTEMELQMDDVAKTHNELLALASEVTQEQRNLNTTAAIETIEPVIVTSTLSPGHNTFTQATHTTISDLISNSIDRIYKHTKRKSTEVNVAATTAKKSCLTNDFVTSNVFMTTRDETNSSPTILAQSIINIEEQAQQSDSPSSRPVTISIAERLSQRFKGLQDKANAAQQKAAQEQKKPRENPFEKLFNDTVLELEKEKDKVINSLEIANEPSSSTPNDITVISDDEDWEDIEITESAPTANTSTANSGNLQKSKNKGLFQKFTMFSKGNNTKTKKHIPPMVFLPNKKKTKEKAATLPNTSTSSLSPTTPNTKLTNSSNEKSDAFTTNSTNLGFKPVVNIMDDLLPDSPCNDPIDLVPELAPFEPLQDLNDVSSILDSNLSVIEAVAAGINVQDDHHTSMEDALDFISEQQAQDKQLAQTQSKNNMTHVGYSVQSSGANAFKFYCLLENCSFLYSSDALGLENHFMCEHSHVKWNGYCPLCQIQCLPNADAQHSITKEIKHMLEKHANKQQLDLQNETTQHSTSSSHESEERPKIKLRRLTGDCLSTANSENSTSDLAGTSNSSLPITMLGALLNAKPKPPTKEMPPQPQMPLTEPLLLDSNDVGPTTSAAFKNISQDFLITSVTSAAVQKNDCPLQIASVISLKPTTAAVAATPAIPQIPKITNVRTLASKVGNSWSQQIEDERQELIESAAESLEVSQILANAGRPSTTREPVRLLDDSPEPMVVAETVPVAQAKTGDYVITQTISAQYDENSSAAVGFNISIASSTATSTSTTGQESIPTDVSTPITSRQYKCMAGSCKFVSRVPVAMSDHLRFHERRNLSNNRDYFACAFCSYLASSVDDYMKHADFYHIINKGGIATAIALNESNDTATSLTKKINDILNCNKAINANGQSSQGLIQHQNQPEQDSEEVYLKKLRQTIEEIVATTGLPDDKLYRCVVKNCQAKLTEAKYQSHIMFHIGSEGGNPNNYIYKCPHCSAQYHRAAGIKAHIKNHALNRYFCYLCQQTSTNPGQLLKHFSEKHWHTTNMFTTVLLKPKVSNDGAEEILDSGFFVVYTQVMSDEEVKKFGEKLILEWQRKKSGSKTHFKSSEIALLPLVAIFQREVNCGECEYKTKVRTNMTRHLMMHKQNPGYANNSGLTKVASVDPVNPVPCLNSNERFFDKMTNLASSSLVTNISSTTNTVQTNNKSNFTIPYTFVASNKLFTCGCHNCNFVAISKDFFRQHLQTVHSDNMSFRCTFCQEEICKKTYAIDRILSHLQYHGANIYRCEECNYLHYMRYVVERHINEKHATSKVNLITYLRTREDFLEGHATITTYTGKKYKDNMETNQQIQSATATTTTNSRSANSESSVAKSSSNLTKGKGKWICEVCGHKSTTLAQIQTHSHIQHGTKNQYKCAHCNFGSQQLSQILFHIDEKHSGKTREAKCMYRKAVNANEDLADTRPLWQRNDPTRVRHIRGILMEDEEESEEYQKKLGLENVNDDGGTGAGDDEDETCENNPSIDYLGYEFKCYHCNFKTQNFDDLKTQHYQNEHNAIQETAKPFLYQIYKRLCCAICRQFMGNSVELKKHLVYKHNDNRYYAADITIAENDDYSHRLLCGYCSFHCANVEQLYRHTQRAQHSQLDLHIDINDILKLGQSETCYQCTLCTDIFSNTAAIVQHACYVHAGEDSFSFRELNNSLIYRCNQCLYNSTKEVDVLRHMIDHCNRLKKCYFCPDQQPTFIAYMQHCYAEHRNGIRKFREIYPIAELQSFLFNMLIIFPNGLMISKNHLINTRFGKTYAMEELYEDIYKISQQPPIPRLLIGRLVARKSIEAQQKTPTSPQTLDMDVELLPTQAKNISQRRCTVAVNQEDNAATSRPNTPKINIIQKPKKITQRRQTVTIEHKSSTGLENIEFNAPLQPKKISKRRRTVAVDVDTPTCHAYSTSPDPLLIERDVTTSKKRKTTSTPPPMYPSNLDMEPFSYYGQTPTPIDTSKIYTKVNIGGIKTPLTIGKLKNFFNIDCQLKLRKCDEIPMLEYKEYKHVIKACPASHKVRYN